MEENSAQGNNFMMCTIHSARTNNDSPTSELDVAFSSLAKIMHMDKNSLRCNKFVAYSIDIARASTYGTTTFQIRCGNFF